MSESKQDLCPNCGYVLRKADKSHYKCGVRTCNYTYPTDARYFADPVKECPVCHNDTLVYHYKLEEACSNPDCDYTSVTHSKGGNCFIASTVLPDRPSDLEELRCFRNQTHLLPIFKKLYSIYDLSQPKLNNNRYPLIIRQVLITAASQLRGARRSKYPLQKLFLTTCAITLFIMAYILKVISTITYTGSRRLTKYIPSHLPVASRLRHSPTERARRKINGS